MAWVSGGPLPEGHPFRMVQAYPQGETIPEFWILGSSDYGAQVAAHFGLPYCFAWFFTDGQGGQRAIDIYKSTYRPSARHPEPIASICVWALAADTEEEAQHHFSSRAKTRVLRDRGLLLPLEPPEIAAEHPFTEMERTRVEQLRRDSLVGTGPDVAKRILALGGEVGVQEMAIVTWAYHEHVRHRSYELLARELISAA
jgi:luciferase family oxidoreductase group 1